MVRRTQTINSLRILFLQYSHTIPAVVTTHTGGFSQSHRLRFCHGTEAEQLSCLTQTSRPLSVG